MTNTVVDTEYGQVKGKTIDEVSVWKGIPYAKAPVGRLRFRPPQPPEPWEGIYDATMFGPVAIQPTKEIMSFLDNEHARMSEDCLNLNICSPEADEKRRPVMVWIHGGAFMNGSGSSGTYDGTSFAANGDVVVVTFNYRLGVMGFLHFDDINDEYASSGNCGILDQVAALKWVKENIDSFGGDPDRITVFGESAGAMSIGTLLAIPSAKGLFNQAILQSGAARNVLKSETAARVAKKILGNLGMDSKDLSALEEIPADKILKAAEHIPPMALGPVIDGLVIPEHPEIAIAKGSAQDIPVLIGTNKDEYRLFTFFDPTWKQIDESGMVHRLKKMLGPLWHGVEPHVMIQRLDRNLFKKVMSFQIFTFPAVRLAEQQMRYGSPVWMYRFDWESPVFDGGLKATHAMEIPFVWNNINKPEMESLIGDYPDQNIAKQMHQAWIAFAHNGSPNTPLLPDWEQYNLDTRPMMLFNVESKVANDQNKDERLIWEKASGLIK